ncbi:MAG: hypothetical protein H6728_10425 [Myxococcales bacterium]|nr:hypothetical protein [Myxococcales bacterium]MCB9643473.1 hypothetical protein [Myxococcales bacterium]
MARFVFDPERLHALALDALDETRGSVGLEAPLTSETPQLGYDNDYYQRLFRGLIQKIDEAYPTRIKTKQEWLFRYNAGMQVQICPLYASPQEHLMLWGTAVGSRGVAGWRPSSSHETVLDGELWYAHAHHFVRERYRSRESASLGSYTTALVEVPDHVWVLEYRRGMRPLELSNALLNAMLTSLDVRTAAETLWLYSRLNVSSMWSSVRRLW